MVALQQNSSTGIDKAPNDPAENDDTSSQCGFGPCQGTANTVLDLLGEIMVDRARDNDGSLNIAEITAVIDTFKTAPGQLSGFYGRTYESCHEEPKATPVEEVNFNQKVGKLAGGGPVAIGRIQTVGLSEIKDELGSRWPRFAEQIDQIATNIIRGHLTRWDSFTRKANEDGFLVCFPRLDTTEAWFKAQAIAREIKEQILGEDQRNADIDGELSDSQIARLSNVSAYADSIELPPQEAFDDTSLSVFVDSTLEQAAVTYKARAKDVLADIAQTGFVRPRPVLAANATATNLEICEFDPKSQAKIKRLLACAEEDAATLAELDLTTLGLASEYLQRRVVNDRHLLVLSVHYATLAHSEHAQRYLEACDATVDRDNPSFVLKLTNCPSNLPVQEIEHYIQQLQPFSQLNMLSMEPLTDGTFSLPQARLNLVSVDYHNIAAQAHRDSPALASLIMNAKKAGMRFVIENLVEDAPLNQLRRMGATLFAYQATSPL